MPIVKRNVLVINPDETAYQSPHIIKAMNQCKEIEDKATGSCLLVIYLEFNDCVYWNYYKHILTAYKENKPITCWLSYTVGRTNRSW